MERDRLGKEIEELRRELAEAEKVSAGADDELVRYQTQVPRQASLALLHEHGQRVGLVDGRCPLCGAQRSGRAYQEHLNNLADAVAKSAERLTAVAKTAAQASSRVSDLRGRLGRLATALSAAQQGQTELDADRETIERDVRRVGIATEQGELDANRVGREADLLRREVAKIEKAIAVTRSSDAVDRQRALESEAAAVREGVAVAERRVRHTQAALGQVEDALAVVRRARNEYVEERMAQLEPLLLEIYQRLRPHVAWPEVRYRLRGDVRKMLRLEVGEGLNPSFLFSSGQRRAAGLAFLLAVHLSRSWCALRSIVLDDPVQHVDDYRALHLTETLASIRSTGRQVICTVEDESLGKLLARRLRADRDGGGAIVRMAYSARDGVHVESRSPVPPLSAAVLVPVSA